MRFKRKRRGQIRAVDFTVSLLLFLLMMSQLILVIFNVQTGIRNNKLQPITSDDLEILGRSMLQDEGEVNWGYGKTLPSSFGLADNGLYTSLTLDAAKIARIITGTSFQITSASGFEMFTYEIIKTMLNLEQETDFQMALLPSISVELTVSSGDPNFQAQAVASLPNKFFLENAETYFFIINLTNGLVIQEGMELTNSNGEASITYQDPHLNDPLGEHFVFTIVRKGPLWGMDWDYFSPSFIQPKVVLGSDSGTTIWGGAVNSTTLLVSDILEFTGTPDFHYLSILYQNRDNGYSSKTIDISSTIDGNETISIPNEGLAVFFSIARTNENYRVGIGSYPAILDKNQEGGSFYQIFGEMNLASNLESLLSKVYPVIVRGMLMRCQLTLWSSE